MLYGWFERNGKRIYGVVIVQEFTSYTVEDAQRFGHLYYVNPQAFHVTVDIQTPIGQA